MVVNFRFTVSPVLHVNGMQRMIELARVMDSLGSESGWVLCETRFQAQLLQSELDSVAKSGWKAMPTHEAFLCLSRRLIVAKKGLEYAPSELSDFDVYAILQGLILGHKDVFPILNSEIEDSVLALKSPVIIAVRNFIDSVRLSDRHDGVIRQVVDEFGEVQNEQLRTVELLALFDLYGEFLDTYCFIDPIGFMEAGFELLCVPNVDASILPESIIVNQPTHLFPLEKLLLTRMNQLTPLKLVVDAMLLEASGSELPPSLRYAASVVRLLEEGGIKKEQVVALNSLDDSRNELVKTVFDGGDSVEIGFDDRDRDGVICVWECDSRRIETAQLFMCIQERVAVGESLENFHVIVPELELYLDCLLEHSRSSKIPLSISKGYPLSRTGPASAFKSFLSWVENPTLCHAEAYFGSSLVDMSGIASDSTQDFETTYADLLVPIKDSKIWRNAEQKLHLKWPGEGKGEARNVLELSALKEDVINLGLEGESILVDYATRAILSSYYCIFVEARRGADERLLEYAERFTHVYNSLLALHTETRWVKQLQDSELSPCELLKALRRRFYLLRKSYRAGCHDRSCCSSSVERELYGVELLAYRAIRKAFASSISAFKIRDCAAQNALRCRSVSDVCELLLEYLSHVRLSVLESDGGLTVTEMLDARGSRHKCIFVLGLTRQSFPNTKSTNTKSSGVTVGGFGSFPQLLTEHLAVRSGEFSGIFESYWLLAYVLRHASEIYLTYPKEAETCEQLPASLLEALVDAGVEVRYLSSVLQVSPALAGDTEESTTRVRLLKERNSNVFTEYDGLVGSKALSDFVSVNSVQPLEKLVFRYTVSELELLADCRHKFFFRRLLGLKQVSRAFSDEVERHTGILVHAALEHFYNRFEVQKKALGGVSNLNDASFNAACRCIYDIAADLFVQSAIDWKSHPAFRQAVLKITAGLCSGGAPDGYLKTALIIQKDVLQSWPTLMEYRFGSNSNKVLCAQTSEGKMSAKRIDDALLVSYAEGQAEVCGIIDRVDYELGSIVEAGIFSAVWDYKTNHAPSLSDVEHGRHLQIPLYAAVLRQNFGKQAALNMGGCLLLGSQKQSKYGDPDIRKAVIELLASEKKGRSISLSTETIDCRISSALELVGHLDTCVREGIFSQQSKTRGCEFCEFSSICCRSQTLVEQKERGDSSLPCNGEFRRGSSGLNPSEPVLKKHNTSRIRLSSEQEDASDISSSVFLSAGAGSGKTAVLRTRVVRLLLSGTPLDAILAITFTEKAAEEISHRVLQTIYAALRANMFDGAELTTEERKRLIEAYARFPEVQICTIHSFAARIVQMDPMLGGRAALGRVLEAGRAKEIISASVDEALRVTEPGGSEDTDDSIDVLLSQGIAYRFLRDQIKQLASNSRDLAALLRSPVCSPNNADDLHVSVLLKGIIASSLNECLVALRPTLIDWLNAAQVWLSLGTTQSILTDVQKQDFAQIVQWAEELNSEEAIADPQQWNELLCQVHRYLVDHKVSAVRKSAKKSPRNLWKDLTELVEDALKYVGHYEPQREARGIRHSRIVVKLASKAAQLYDEAKQRTSSSDFDEIIFTAHTMLCGQSSSKLESRQKRLRARLAERFQHIMIDEFQDTDPQQWDILRAIASVEDGVSRTLFLVGDEQQAIYGFRDGDVRAYRNAQKEALELGAKNLELDDNYRSSEGVVSFVNALFSQLFVVSEQEIEAEHVPQIASVAVRKMVPKRNDVSVDGSSAVSVLRIPYDKELRAVMGGKDLEARHTALFIKEVLDDYIQGSKRWPELQSYKEEPIIAVLTRTAKQLLLVSKQLEQLGVPFGVTHSVGYFELDEVLQLENLCKALYDPTDAIAIVGLLRSVLIGLSDAELLSTCAEIEGNWFRLLQDQPILDERTEALRLKLCTWRRLSRLIPTSLLLELIIEETRVGDAYCRVGMEDEYNNMRRCVDAIRHAEHQNSASHALRDVVQWFSTQRYDAYRAPVASSTNQPIVLTTVHGAKGLEYPMVVLPFLSDRRPQDRDFVFGEYRQDGVVYPLLGLKVADEDGVGKKQTSLCAALDSSALRLSVAEEQRVFYVACTRARDYLVIGMRETAAFLKEQGTIQSLNALEKQNKYIASDKPNQWLRATMVLDDLEQPQFWSLAGTDGQEVRVPIVEANSKHFTSC